MYRWFWYFLTSASSLSVSLQPEEYGQEAMEGQGEAMLEPEGETYDETQQVISPHDTKLTHVCSTLQYISRLSVWITQYD